MASVLQRMRHLAPLCILLLLSCTQSPPAEQKPLLPPYVFLTDTIIPEYHVSKATPEEALKELQRCIHEIEPRFNLNYSFQEGVFGSDKKFTAHFKDTSAFDILDMIYYLCGASSWWAGDNQDYFSIVFSANEYSHFQVIPYKKDYLKLGVEFSGNSFQDVTAQIRKILVSDFGLDQKKRLRRAFFLPYRSMLYVQAYEEEGEYIKTLVNELTPLERQGPLSLPYVFLMDTIIPEYRVSEVTFEEALKELQRCIHEIEPEFNLDYFFKENGLGESQKYTIRCKDKSAFDILEVISRLFGGPTQWIKDNKIYLSAMLVGERSRFQAIPYKKDYLKLGVKFSGGSFQDVTPQIKKILVNDWVIRDQEWRLRRAFFLPHRNMLFVWAYIKEGEYIRTLVNELIIKEGDHFK